MISKLKNIPFGGEAMRPAWLSSIVMASYMPELVLSFMKQTGLNWNTAISVKSLNALINGTSSYEDPVVLAFVDWVTDGFWGVEDSTEK